MALFVGNCPAPLRDGPNGAVTCDGPEFFTPWRDAAAGATRMLGSDGAPVVWVLPPRRGMAAAIVAELALPAGN